MRAVKILGLVILLWAGAVWAQGKIVAEPAPPPVRPLILQAPAATIPIKLTRVNVDVLVVGRIARTTVELVFRNPNARVLEGELQFPLLDGQQVTAFALDFDGKWRTAVPVEKARGQAIFEDTIRQRVDPALLEATAGNNYKLRVYPLPAQGERKVALTITETLVMRRDGSAKLRLPLAFGQKLETFALNVHAPGVLANAARIVRGLPESRWENHEGASLSVQRRDYRPEDVAEFAFALPDTPLVSIEEHDGKQYFYAEFNGPRLPAAARPKPARLALVWDASGSGATRDHGREFALLDRYFKAIGDSEVSLTLARDLAEPGGRFTIKAGNWSALRQVLEKVVYDGATNLAAMHPSDPTDAVLLFSDGLGNFGTPGFPAFKIPLLAVNAAAAADRERLRHAAAQSGGVFVDLVQLPTAAAATALTQVDTRLSGLRANEASALVASPLDPASGKIAVAGVLNGPVADIDLDWTLGTGSTQRQRIRIKRSDTRVASFAAQAWARLRLNQLLPEATLNQAEIVRLGKNFGLVTPGTSLIVLDRVEDYVQHEIVPPAELRAEYEQRIGQRRAQSERDRSAHLEDIVRRFKEKQAWWERDFPKDEPPKVSAEEKVARAPASAPMEARPAAPVAAARVRSDGDSGTMDAPRQNLASTGAFAKRAEAPGKAESSMVASIQLKKWQPDAPYAERLRKADKADLYRVYLDEKPGYANSTAFFLDVADIFFERGLPELGVRILSNLAEMDLENRHILRILGYRLQQAKRADLAVPILQKVSVLAPNEPQSWRDLGLAQADAGDRQQALASLYQVVVKPWHNRFPDIELVTLAELNALIATAPDKLDLSAIDPRLIRNLPLDLRVVLAWDADNTDIDLYVIDPNGEQAFFGKRLTRQGGAVSRDFTGGYGPEEYSLRKAKPGKYVVKARFYGHRQQVVAGATTLNLRLYTGFGTLQQKEQQVTLRLTGQGNMVTVGEFVVGAP